MNKENDKKEKCLELMERDDFIEALDLINLYLEEEETADLFQLKAICEKEVYDKRIEEAMQQPIDFDDPFGEDQVSIHEVQSPYAYLKRSDYVASIKKAISISPEACYYFTLAKFLFEQETNDLKHNTDANFQYNDRLAKLRSYKENRDYPFSHYIVMNGEVVLSEQDSEHEISTPEPLLSNSKAYSAILQAIELDNNASKYLYLLYEILVFYKEFESAIGVINEYRNLTDEYLLLIEEADCLFGLSRTQEAIDVLNRFFNTLQATHLNDKPKDWLDQNENNLFEAVTLLFRLKQFPLITQHLEPYLDILIQFKKHYILEYYYSSHNKILISNAKYKEFLSQPGDIVKYGVSGYDLLGICFMKKEYELLREQLNKALSDDNIYCFNLSPHQVEWYRIWVTLILEDMQHLNDMIDKLLIPDFNSTIRWLRDSSAPADLDDLLTDTDPSFSEEYDDWINSYFLVDLPIELMPIDSFKLLLSKFFNKHADKIEAIASQITKQTRKRVLNSYSNLAQKIENVSQILNIINSMNKYLLDLPENKQMFLGYLIAAINHRLNRLHLESVYNSKIEERDRILSNLSHSIKNLLISVSNPLYNIRQEIPKKANIIDSALRGTSLIREIVNSINMSLSISIDDLIYDIKHPDENAHSLERIINDALIYSIGNMFDFKYFNKFADNYFPKAISNARYAEIKEAWQGISDQHPDQLVTFANAYMFDLSCYLEDAKELIIGDEKSSAVKLMILFQEIIFNAVKYSSYVKREQRCIEIILKLEGDFIIFSVKNSFRPEIMAKSTGFGKTVIENYVRVLDCEPEIQTANSIYSITLKFKNLWR